jgi:hypothetical protein
VEVGEDVDDAGPASGFSLSGWLEKMLRELPFPCGPGPHLAGGKARCGFDRDGDWPLTKFGPSRPLIRSMHNAHQSRGQKHTVFHNLRT